MTLRARLTLAAAAAVAVTIAFASVGTYVAARSVLRGQVDAALRDRAELAQLRTDRVALPPPVFGEAAGIVRLVEGSQRAGVSADELALPLDDRARQVAAGERGQFFEDQRVDGVHMRILTTQIAPGFALQIARPLEEVDRTLRRLALVLALFAVGGVALAGGLGRVVAQTTLRPVRALSDTANDVATTRDLGKRIDTPIGGELGTLAASFNTMLEALQRSDEAQRQLVADASHELRTPLTSLRTNVELLARRNGLSTAERRRALDEVVGQLDELTGLVSDVVELARGAEPGPQAHEQIRLDDLVEAAVERAQRHWPALTFSLDTAPHVVRGDAARLERAVGNLLENAAKWSPPDGEVEVAVRDGEIVVRDHGPGIAPSDLPHVFDRFYRSPSARGMPGSGLGLAIARQVAESHGGTIAVENARDGGAIFRLKLFATP